MNSLLAGLARLSLRRAPWLLLAAIALALECTALWFQHVRGLDPCVLCVYERTAVLGVLLAALLGSLAPGRALPRRAGLLLWVVSAAWGVQLAARHTGIQFSEGLDLSCSYFADFPTWAPLDQWLPAVFLPSGFCDAIQWQFVGLSMPQWMLIIFALLLTAALLIAAARLFGTRETD